VPTNLQTEIACAAMIEVIFSCVRGIVDAIECVSTKVAAIAWRCDVIFKLVDYGDFKL
jgi:hypothetical protein